MNTLGIDYTEDLTEQIDDAGDKVKIGSTWIPCLVSDERRSAEITEESALDVFDREIEFTADSVAAPPQQNSTVIVGTTRYFVYEIQNDTDRGIIILFVRRNADGRIS